MNLKSILLFCFLISNASFAEKTPTAILVDKKTNSLFVAETRDGIYHVSKTYHVVVGKVKGDKEDEGDLKTPEGIYVFDQKKSAPHITKKLGVRAFHVDYPNTYDKLVGKTGSEIMLHGTDTPDRLKKDYDSEGCVVLQNEEVLEIEPSIRVGLTPILIFQELTKEFLEPGKDEKLKAFFEKWLHAWETKDVATYIDGYHSDFKAQGMDKSAWRGFKTNLTKRYDEIKVSATSRLFYRHPKYSLITFTQDYRSTFKNHRPAMVSKGTKILYVAEEKGEPKIIAESFTSQVW